jgi:hypothetical protein
VSASYSYLFLTLKRGANPHVALAAQLKSEATRLDGAELVGQFAPQLGWASNEAAVLWRFADNRGGLSSSTGLVDAMRPETLSPTLRPGDADVLEPGGIYVHRWFEMDAAAVDEFVALSAQGWDRFEAQFDARIFGLFRAAPSHADRELARLLLLTRYGDHGVWEASRDPTTEAMQIFARRQQLTRRSWAASSRLV